MIVVSWRREDDSGELEEREDDSGELEEREDDSGELEEREDDSGELEEREKDDSEEKVPGFQPIFPPRQRFQHPTSDGQPQHSSTVRSTVEKVYTSTIDPDVAQMETMLDQWCLELKRNVLAEFGQSKTRVVTNCREEVMRETEK
nr:hypothetical protein BaRGS_019025 [Batillaria attramentaria]